MTTDESPLPDGFAEHLARLTETINALRGMLDTDHTLSTEEHMLGRRLLFLTSEPISEARRLLPKLPEEDTPQESELLDSVNDYDEALSQLERDLCWLIQALRTEQLAAKRYDEAPAEKFITALEYGTALRDILPQVPSESHVVSDQESITPGDVDPEISGRGDGDGRWLEFQLQRALRRWGYVADTRQHLFSLEIDVVATQRPKQQEPSDWIVAQCKDWTSDPITPAPLFRLCTVAFACRAMPVLCHTTELTPRAETLARELEVRVLTLTDLQRAELPTPQVAKPTISLDKTQSQFRARDARGSLPLMFYDEPGKRFSYVPGFTPVGRDAEYEPIEREQDDDTHPAAGH
jgi:hypothetical protein